MTVPESLQSWSLTDVGKVRDHNEDSFIVDRKLRLFVVADGMGGHAAGEVASQIAVRSVRDFLAREGDALAEFELGHGGTTRNDILRLLESAVQQACSAVHAAGKADESKRGMGTTLEVLLIVGSRGFIAHVGDSRVYLYRQGSVHQLTEDHSLINELMKRGRLTKDQIAKVQYKNAVTRAVGVYESVEVDTFDFDVLAGDRFVLCSDGLHGYLADGELGKFFDDTPEENVVERLIALANDRGGKDNITVLVIRVPDAESGVDKLAREVNLKIDILRRMPLFRHLSYKELVRVLNITDVRSYTALEPVMREGEEGDELLIMLTGRVRVHKGEANITHLGPGQHIGEMALLERLPRSASVTAEHDSKLLAIRRGDFFDIVRRDHDVAVKLLWSFAGVLANRLRSTSKELSEARAKIAKMEGSVVDLTDELLGFAEETPRTARSLPPLPPPGAFRGPTTELPKIPSIAPLPVEKGRGGGDDGSA